VKVYAHTIQIAFAFQQTKCIRHRYQRFELCTNQSKAFFWVTCDWMTVLWVDLFDLPGNKNNKHMVLKTLKLK